MSSITYLLAAFAALQATGVLSASISSRIAGGKDAYPGEYPYQVSIQYGVPPLVKYHPICGGAILNKSWIVTSASCLTLIPKFGKIQVKAGLHELKNDGEWVQAVEAPLRFVHSDYEANVLKAIKPNDIGLLKLKTPLRLNSRVQPVVLPARDQKPTGQANITGWGLVPGKILVPKLPKSLQVADVIILSEENCNDALRYFVGNQKMDETQLCTGPLFQKISACLGDHGDPLVQVGQSKDGKDLNILIGVTSWFPLICGQQGSPTVYTQVSSFIDWILETIRENNK